MPQVRITDRWLQKGWKALLADLDNPPAQEPVQIDYYDTDRASPQGFGVRVSKHGTRTFFVKHLEPDGFGGKRQKRTFLKTEAGMTARYPDVSLADARDLGFALRKRIAAGETATAAQKRLSFKALVDDYIEKHAKVKKRSWKEDERILVKGPYFEDWHRRPAGAITRAEVVERIQKIKGDNGPIMANRALASFRKAYGYVSQNMPRGYEPLGPNPAREISAPGQETKADRVFTDDEIKALWKAFGEVGVAGQLYMLALVTGQRIGEVRGLDESELDEREEGVSVWGLPGTRTKNKLPHVVPLTSLALTAIAAARKLRVGKSTLLFPSTRKPKVPISIGSKIVDDVRERSGVKDFSAHHLRRTVSTNITRLGFSRFIADRVLNHIEKGVGGTYDRYEYLKEKTAALEAWERHLLTLTGKNVVQLKTASA